MQCRTFFLVCSLTKLRKKRIWISRNEQAVALTGVDEDRGQVEGFVVGT